MTEHHFRKLRPTASSKTLTPCPGSIVAQFLAEFHGFDRPTVDKSAESGTRIHRALEMQSCEILNNCDEEIEIYEELNSKKDKILSELNMQYGEGETRFCITEGGELVMSAQVDVVAFDEEPDGYHCAIIEFKTVYFGNHQKAEENAQLRRQMVAFDEYFTKKYKVPLYKFTLALIQTGHPTSVAEFDRAGIDAARAETLAEVAAARRPNALRIPGEHCRWCAANGTPACPESIKQLALLGEAVAEFDGMDDISRSPFFTDWMFETFAKFSAIEAGVKRFREWLKTEQPKAATKFFSFGTRKEKGFAEGKDIANYLSDEDLTKVFDYLFREKLTPKALSDALGENKDNYLRDNGLLVVTETPTIKSKKGE